MFYNQKKNEEGMDLVEVIVAVMLVLAAIVSLTFLLVKSQKTQAENETVDKAALILQDYSEKSRVVPWDRLGSSRSATSVCSSTLNCAGEYYYYIPKPADGYAMPLTEKTTVSGTEYTVATHITRTSKTTAGWENIKSADDPASTTKDYVGNDRACSTKGSGLTSTTTSVKDSDTKKIYCSLKHITIVVSWKDTANVTRSISSSWVRSPNAYEETSAVFTG